MNPIPLALVLPLLVSVVAVAVVFADLRSNLPANVDPAIALAVHMPEYNPDAYMNDRSLYVSPNSQLNAGPPPTRKQAQEIIDKFDAWLKDGVPPTLHNIRIVPSRPNHNFSRDDLRFGRFLKMVPVRTLVTNEHIVMQPIEKLLGYLPVCEDSPRQNHNKPENICAFLKFARELFRDTFYQGGPQAFDADPIAVVHSQLMEIALLLVHIRFADPQLQHPRAAYFKPYVSALPFEADIPLCSFGEDDLDIFVASKHLLRTRYEVLHYHYKFVVEHVLPHFPGVFGGDDHAATAAQVLTPSRYLWAYCLARSRHEPHQHRNGQLILAPPADFIVNRRFIPTDKRYKAPFQRSIRWPPAAPAENQSSYHMIVLRYTYPANEEIVWSRLFSDTTALTAAGFIEFNYLDDQPRFMCAAVDLPMPNETAMWTPCVKTLFTDLQLCDSTFRYEGRDLLYQAALREAELIPVLDKAERHYIYNKTCTEWFYHHGKYQRRTYQTRLDTVVWFSVLVRGQLRRTNAQVVRMEEMMTMFEKQKQQQQENSASDPPTLLELPPHIDMIYKFSEQQRQLLTRIQSVLSDMSKKLRVQVQGMEDELAEIEAEEQRVREEQTEQQRREREERRKLREQHTRSMFAPAPEDDDAAEAAEDEEAETT